MTTQVSAPTLALVLAQARQLSREEQAQVITALAHQLVQLPLPADQHSMAKWRQLQDDLHALPQPRLTLADQFEQDCQARQASIEEQGHVDA